MTTTTLKRFEQPQVEKRWLTSAEAKQAYTYVPADSPLPAIGVTAEEADAMAYVKLFNPSGSWTCYLTEADRETGEAFGLVDGHEMELGYLDLNEIAGTRGHMGLPIERDIHWAPQRLSAIRKEHGR